MALTTELESGGVTYSFRLPTSKDMVEMDLGALRIRQAQTDGLGMAIPMSLAISTLQRLCVSPEKIDFSALPFYEVETMSDEVSNWINSFRKPLGEAKNPINTGESGAV